MSMTMPTMTERLFTILASPNTVLLIILVICLPLLALNGARRFRKWSHLSQGAPVVPSRFPLGQCTSRTGLLQDYV